MNDPLDSETVTPHLEDSAAVPQLPWPPAPGQAITDALSRTWHGAALQPRPFFSRIPEDAAPGPAVLYYMLVGIAVEGAQLFWSMVLRTSNGSEDLTGMLGMTEPLGSLIDFLLSPLLLLFSLFVAAGAAHLMLQLPGAAARGYRITLIVFAFAYSPQILGIVPRVGQAAGFIWMVVIAIIGLSAAHRTSLPRAAAAVLVPLVAALGVVAVAAMIGAAGSLLTGVGA